MTTYNGFELNYSKQELDDMLNNQTSDIMLISKDFNGYIQLDDNDKKSLNHLIQASKIFNDVALKQDNLYNYELKQALEDASKNGDEHAKSALKLFNSLNGVSGLNGVDAEPICIFKNLNTPIGKAFYPSDLTVEEFSNILLLMFKNEQIEDIRHILSSRTMVVRDNDKLKAIDYTEYFKTEFTEIANQLEAAAKYSTNKDFSKYLRHQAQALLNNDEELDMQADMLWANLQDTPLEFTIGRENYDDEMTSTILDNTKLHSLITKHNIEVVAKDTLGARVGIINKDGTNLLLTFKDMMPKLSSKMPYSNTYKQSISDHEDVKQTMVDTDIAYLSGDYAMCRGGITTAQNLPNNDKLSIKRGGGRRNVYHRQIRNSYNAERIQKVLNNLLHPNFHQYFDIQACHLFVIGHENGHSLGPSSEYQNSPGISKSIIEETKADTISISFMPEYVKAGIITDLQLKQIYTSWTINYLMLISQPIFPTQAHRIGDLIQFNYLIKYNAIWFDDDKLLHIDFEKMAEIEYDLLSHIVDIQLSKSPLKAKNFIDKYSTWNDINNHISNIQKSLGLKRYKKIISYF